MGSPETIAERIKAFNAAFLPDKVQLKYKCMAEDPFRFFRGTCHLFYEDLSKASPLPSSPPVWMSGDLHVENLGTYKGDNRLVYFDINDFDESMLGPANWELVRMVASIYVALGNLEEKKKRSDKHARLFLDAYFNTLAKGKALYIEPRTGQGIVKKFLTTAAARKQKQLLRKHTVNKKGQLVFLIDNQKKWKLEKTLKKELTDHISRWMTGKYKGHNSYRVIDACFRVAGTGSIGVKRYLFLLQSVRNKKNYLLLDMKQARHSCLAPYIQIEQPSWKTEADRVTTIQQRMQNVSPALLNTTIFKEDSYLVQEMQPVEDKVNFNLIKGQYNQIGEVISSMAMLTASAHLRSCSRQGAASADDLINFGNSKAGYQELMDYSIYYTAQVKGYFKAYLKAYKSGFFSPGSSNGGEQGH